jgi:hypothetical protein
MRANISVEILFPSELSADWNWLLRRLCALIAMNNFGDMFLRDSNGEIQLLVLTSGSLTKIADSQAEFQNLVAAKENQRAWFSLDLLTEIERAGMSLAPGQCFSFKKPLVLGGACEISNVEVAPISVYVSLIEVRERSFGVSLL